MNISKEIIYNMRKLKTVQRKESIPKIYYYTELTTEEYVKQFFHIRRLGNKLVTKPAIYLLGSKKILA